MFQQIRDMWFRTLLIGLAVIPLLTVMGLVHFGLLWAQTATTIIYVQPVAVGMGDGSSWSNATTLQDALQHRADAGMEIWVAAGTHYPVTPVDPATITTTEQGISFTLDSELALYGGFAGTETARNQRDPATNLTVLSGDIDQDNQNQLGGRNSWTVVAVRGTAATAVVDGFTITGASSVGVSVTGGSSPPFTNVTISGNGSTGANEVGVDIEASNPTFTDVTISNNSAIGVDISGSPPFTNVTISGNGSTGVSIADANSQPTFTNVTIDANRSNNVNVWNGSSPPFTNVTISGNGRTDVNEASVDIEASSLTATSVVTNNLHAGVSISDASSPTFTDVTISDNSHFGVGMRESSATFSAMTITDNSLGVGMDYASNATFTDVAITDNGGNGVGIIGDSNATFTDVAITDNGARGVEMFGGDVTFTDVIISNNRDSGVFTNRSSSETDNVTFSAVTVTDNGTDGVVLLPRWSATFTDVTISDNGRRGMYIGETTSPTCTNVIIRDNTDADVEYEGPQPSTSCLPEQ